MKSVALNLSLINVIVIFIFIVMIVALQVEEQVKSLFGMPHNMGECIACIVVWLVKILKWHHQFILNIYKKRKKYNLKPLCRNIYIEILTMAP